MILLATLAVAVAALWGVSRRASRSGRRGVPSGSPGAAGDPEGSAAGAGPEAVPIPSALTSAWVQFLRDDLANAVNALNSRLNVIANTVPQLGQGHLSPDEQRGIEQIKAEIARATEITGGLLQRVTAAAREMPPPVWNVLRDRPVRPGHIMVVEDDEANRAVLIRLFEGLGHRVTPVSNGIEAYDLLRRSPVDCIICDLRMPLLGGKGLYEQVEAQMPQLASRFVFVTGDYIRPSSRNFLVHAGQPVIGKPYEVGTLLAAVATVLASAGVLTQDL